MFCDKCGAQVSPGMAFCEKCGNPLSAAQTSPVQPAAPVPPAAPPMDATVTLNTSADQWGASQPPQSPSASGYTPPPADPWQQPAQQSDPWQQPAQPQQTAYGQPQPAYPPGEPPQGGSGKKAIIISCVIAGILILAGAMVFIFRDSIFGSNPAPALTAAPPVTQEPADDKSPEPTAETTPDADTPELRGAELEGYWDQGLGPYLYFIGTCDYIEFTLTADGKGLVYYGSDTQEEAEWVLGSEGILTLKRGNYSHDFTYAVSGDMLTMTDDEGDRRVFTRNPDGSRPDPQTQPSLGEELAGIWNRGTGTYIYWFVESDEIEFVYTGGSTGRVWENETGEWADWEVKTIGGNNILCIDGYISDDGESGHGYQEFEYRIIGDTLTLIDEDGDTRTYKKE